ncbi:hypothetical protein NQD34_009989 [Periophthalmus magnuspinnatus]|nr:hypothetical protein NQD34_009989 [Periophthalmus magnuspinnatus]
MSLRVLEIIFFLYFASHVPITLLIDLQALLPARLYPEQLRDVLLWYGSEFKDPMVLDPPLWFKSFIFCEALVQLPFFPVAAYAFLKGGCRWIRTPAIVYSTHTATTLIPILAHILFSTFPSEPFPGPQTQSGAGSWCPYTPPTCSSRYCSCSRCSSPKPTTPPANHRAAPRPRGRGSETAPNMGVR